MRGKEGASKDRTERKGRSDLGECWELEKVFLVS